MFISQIKYILATLFIIISYITFNPLEPDIIQLQKNSYSLETKNIKEDIASYFDDKSHGKFYVHPGAEKVTKGIFTFKYAMTLHFELNPLINQTT